MSVDEIYDVKVIENYMRPSLLSHDMEIHRQAITTPKGSFWNVAQKNIQQKSSNDNTNKKTVKYTFKLLKNIKLQDLIKNLHQLLPSGFIPILEEKEYAGFLIAIITLADNKAIAMTIIEITKERTAIIHSVFVLQAFRRQTIATNMLLQAEKIFAENRIVSAEAILSIKANNAEIIQKLFRKSKTINLVSKK